MTFVTPAQMESWLTDYGWRFEATETAVWRTGFSGEKRYYPVTIRLTPTCLSLEVRPLFEMTAHVGLSHGLAQELLLLNETMQVAKLALTGDGEVVLVCQVLTIAVDYETFTQVLGILGYYADAVAPDLLIRATSQGHFSLLC